MTIEIKGNQKAKDLLTQSVHHQKLSHAYLFYGEDSFILMQTARFFAQAVLCRSPQAGYGCGVCLPCKKIEQGIHPDVTVVQEPKKTGKGAISIETVRAVRKDAYIRPNEGKFRVFIFTDVEQMSIGAINALLKIVEEPPPHVLFVLTSKNNRAVPETIRSRCVNVKLHATTVADCIEVLKQRYPQAEQTLLTAAAEICSGNIGQAAGYVEQGQLPAAYAATRAMLEAVISGTQYDVLKSLSVLERSREQLRQTLQAAIEALTIVLEHKLRGTIPTDALLCTGIQTLSVARLCRILAALQSGLEQLELNMNLPLLTTWLVRQIGVSIER